MWKKSIFNNVTVINNFAYIHFPLIYKTNNQLFIEMYAKSVISFLKFLGINQDVYSKIIDSLVVELLFNEINAIHNTAYNCFYDYKFLVKTEKKLKKIYKEMPILIKELEDCIIKNVEISFAVLEKIFYMFVDLLAVNNLSFIVETLLPEHILKSNNKESDLSYMTKEIFSHIKYFNNEKEELIKKTNEKNLILFLKNTSFLENELGDETTYENVQYISELLNKKMNRIDLINSEFKYPKIEFNIEKNDFEKYPIIIIWSKILQINLEFRHYWLLRFSRNLRIYYNYNYDIINNWTLNDYAK